MARKKAASGTRSLGPTAPVSRLTDEGLLLVLTDIAARAAIQHYANLIGRRDPVLYRRLTEAVEAAGGWGDSELEAATAPEEEP